MNKSQKNSKKESLDSKKNATNFGRIAAKLDTGKKLPVFESSLDKLKVWNKKQVNC